MSLVRIEQELTLIISKAMEGERKAQKMLYERFSGRVLSTCRQYIDDLYVAEDMMLNVFLKVFRSLHRLERTETFIPWMHRITVNECLSYLRSRKQIIYAEPEENSIISTVQSDDNVIMNDLQDILDSLPFGCKMVFNLYAIEGYKHQEIAEMLEISEGTSKSQLAYARKLLQEKINKLNQAHHG